MGMDHWNKHSKNRFQKQLIETSDSQFHSGVQYTSHSIVFLLFHLLICLFVCYVDNTSNTVLLDNSLPISPLEEIHCS